MLNSFANRAASAGVFFLPVPPIRIGGPSTWCGLGSAGRVLDLHVLTVVVERVADRRTPQTGHDVESFLEQFEAILERRERDAVRLVLFLVPAGTDAEVYAATTHLIDLCDRDGQRSGVTERSRRHQSAEADGGCFAGDSGERDPRVGGPGKAVGIHGEIVVRAEKCAVAEFFGGLGNSQ